MRKRAELIQIITKMKESNPAVYETAAVFAVGGKSAVVAFIDLFAVTEEMRLAVERAWRN